MKNKLIIQSIITLIFIFLILTLSADAYIDPRLTPTDLLNKSSAILP